MFYDGQWMCKEDRSGLDGAMSSHQRPIEVRGCFVLLCFFFCRYLNKYLNKLVQRAEQPQGQTHVCEPGFDQHNCLTMTTIWTCLLSFPFIYLSPPVFDTPPSFPHPLTHHETSPHSLAHDTAALWEHTRVSAKWAVLLQTPARPNKVSNPSVGFTIDRIHIKCGGRGSNNTPPP